MKRFFFSLIALAAVAASCTQSALVETPDLNGTEITFNPYTGRTPVTRATQVATKEALASPGFHVLGYLHKDNQVSTLMDGLVHGTSWQYDGDKVYWPDATTASTTSLSFVAYSANVWGKDSEMGTEDDHINWTSDSEFTFSVNPTVSDQVDLLATKYQSGLTLVSNSQGTVDLDFIHLLSRVGFQLKAKKDNSNIQITISKLELHGSMPTTGTLDLFSAEDKVGSETDNEVIPALEVGEPSEVPVVYSLLTKSRTMNSSATAAQITNPGDDAANCYMMIMPHTSTDDKIYIEYTITSTEGHSSSLMKAEVPILKDKNQQPFTFQPGTAYEFVLEVSTSSIGFDVKETPWNNAGTGENMDEPFPVNPQPADHIDVAASVTGTSTASVAVNVNIDTYDVVYVQYKDPADENWNNAAEIEVETYAANEVGGPYVVELSGLKPNTTYQYRAKAIVEGSSNTPYYTDKDQTFTTLAVITTNDETAITTFGATVSATWDASENGTASLKEVGFCWLEKDENNSAPTTRLYLGKVWKYKNTNNEEVKLTTDNFSYTINTLYPNKTYLYRPYVINNDGGVSYGAIGEFTTSIGIEFPTPGEGEDDGTGDDDTEGDEDNNKPINPWDEPTDEDVDFENVN